MIIDAHTHIFSEESYLSYAAKSLTPVSKIVTIHFWTNEGLPKYSLEQLLNFANTKENLYVVAAVNILHNIPKQLEVLERLLRDRKIVGIKMYPGYQLFYPFDADVHPVAMLCEKYGVPLIFHSGDVSHRGSPQLHFALPIHIDRLAVLFPQCKIVIAHFGFPYMLEAAMIANKNNNVFLDLSGTLTRTSTIEESLAQQKAYGDDLIRALAYFPLVKQKVMFGTDYGGEHSHINQVESYIELTQSVFSKHEQEQVFSGVAEELFFRRY